MKLTFLGGADEVGASGTLIEIAGKKLLVDAGIRILAKTRRKIGDDQLPDLSLISEAGGIDYILITHAHTDHTGALPLVVERYPDAPVLTTAPSMALIRVLQADAQRIMKLNHEQEGELPLFDAVAS
ncbi:MAG: MBL fold metallo-hydrolase, partial [Phototrophicales bacterium]